MGATGRPQDGAGGARPHATEEPGAYRLRRHRGGSRHDPARRPAVGRVRSRVGLGGRAGRPRARAGGDGVLRDGRARRDHGHARQRPARSGRHGRPHRCHLRVRLRRGDGLQLVPASAGGATGGAATGHPGPRRLRPRARERHLHDRAPLPHPGELREHHAEGPGPDARRTVEDPGARRSPVVPVQGVRRPGGDRGADCVERRAVAQPDLHAHPDRGDDVRRRGVPQPQERSHRHHRQQLPDDRRRQDRLRPDQGDLRLLHRRDRLPQDHQGREPHPDRRLDPLLLRAELRVRLLRLRGP